MATQTICDGCGMTLLGDGTRLGVVVKRDYCPTCLPIVEDYLASRDKIHDRVARAWKKDLARLKSTTKKSNTRMGLPDDA